MVPLKPQLQAISLKHRNLSFLAGNTRMLAGYTPAAAFDSGWRSTPAIASLFLFRSPLLLACLDVTQAGFLHQILELPAILDGFLHFRC